MRVIGLEHHHGTIIGDSANPDAELTMLHLHRFAPADLGAGPSSRWGEHRENAANGIEVGHSVTIKLSVTIRQFAGDSVDLRQRHYRVCRCVHKW